MRDKDNEPVVIKANELIQQYKYTLSKTEIRIVNYIISNISSPMYDEELNVMTFNINEFCKMLGWNEPGGDNYKKLRYTLRKLSLMASDYIDFGEYETIVRWIERPIFEKGTGLVKLKLDDYLKPFLLQANGKIQAKLKFYFEMDSKYSMRLYELLRSYDGFKTKRFDIDDLRVRMDALKKSYSNFGMFKRSALDVAVAEINSVTDLRVSYEEIRRGKKVTHIEFKINKVKKSKNDTAEQKPEGQQEFKDPASMDNYVESYTCKAEKTKKTKKKDPLEDNLPDEDFCKSHYQVMMDGFPGLTGRQAYVLFNAACPEAAKETENWMYMDFNEKQETTVGWIMPLWRKIMATPERTKSTHFDRLLSDIEIEKKKIAGKIR